MNKTLLSAFAISAAMASSGGVVVYPEYDARIERDYAYAVRVSQGPERKRLVVYNHCEKSALTTRTRGGDVNRRFCEFAFDGGIVRVDIAVSEDVKSYAVFPSLYDRTRRLAHHRSDERTSRSRDARFLEVARLVELCARHHQPVGRRLSHGRDSSGQDQERRQDRGVCRQHCGEAFDSVRAGPSCRRLEVSARSPRYERIWD